MVSPCTVGFCAALWPDIVTAAAWGHRAGAESGAFTWLHLIEAARMRRSYTLHHHAGDVRRHTLLDLSHKKFREHFTEFSV
jgi:hypothetical protein